MKLSAFFCGNFPWGEAGGCGSPVGGTVVKIAGSVCVIVRSSAFAITTENQVSTQSTIVPTMKLTMVMVLSSHIAQMDNHKVAGLV